mgnify:CR=1 FL=1
MADASITVANVQISADGLTGRGTAGETITQGMPVYQKASDLRYYKADADASLEAATVSGISLTASSAGQPIIFAVSDPAFSAGFSGSGGVGYGTSATAGKIAPQSDVTAGWWASVFLVCYGDITSSFALSCSPLLISPQAGA